MGLSGTKGVAADELVMSGLSSPSTSFNISPIAITSGLSHFVGGSVYSWVVADATGNSSAFNSLISAFNTALSGYSNFGVTGTLSVSTKSDGGGGEDLMLDFDDTAAPEPTSTLLFGIVAAPLLLVRRRRATTAPAVV
jgi:hypothetical protein